MAICSKYHTGVGASRKTCTGVHAAAVHQLCVVKATDGKLAGQQQHYKQAPSPRPPLHVVANNHSTKHKCQISHKGRSEQGTGQATTQQVRADPVTYSI